ncbi:Rrf2 family transcriptional regulator [Candidatus Woesearchaeota archaeon]|nr:Rrf2 family transcriptional regulator [Candidatus Woesearchaeota archaeon]
METQSQSHTQAIPEQAKATKKQLSDKERLEKGHVLARAIIEVAGAPKDHVDGSIKLVVDHITANDKLAVVAEETFEAEKKDEQEGLFSAFSELELWFSDVNSLMGFAFDYMPSSIEILQPDALRMQTYQVSSLLNELLSRLHQIDLQLKITNAENQLINKNAALIVRNFLVSLLKEKSMSIEEMAKRVGIQKEHLEEFVKPLQERGVLTMDSGVYRLAQ